MMRLRIHLIKRLLIRLKKKPEIVYGNEFYDVCGNIEMSNNKNTEPHRSGGSPKRLVTESIEKKERKRKRVEDDTINSLFFRPNRGYSLKKVRR